MGSFGRVNSSSTHERVFRDLGRHNRYAAKLARLLEDRRERHIARVIEAQRKHRSNHTR